MMDIRLLDGREAHPGSPLYIGGAGPRSRDAVIAQVRLERSSLWIERLLQTSEWSDRRVTVDLPENLNAGRFYIALLYRRTDLPQGPLGVFERGSNVVAVSINAAAGRGNRISTGGMLIERVSPSTITQGTVIEIRGRNFGDLPGGKIVSINRGHVNRMQVLHWSNNLVRARVPQGLGAGNYRLLIYYDESFRTSSNSLAVDVR
jgi:hypothetical protein